MINSAWLVPFFPLAGALIAACAGRWLKGLSHVPVVIGIGLAFLVSLGLLFSAGTPGKVVVYEWIAATDLNIPVVFRVDGLTTMMLAMVTFVATLIAVFASGYMAGDPGYARFFCFIGLFVFSMTGLVLSSNYALTYAFWEGVGACSYLLVGFWYAKPAAAAAAKKAFLVNRVGDFGFAVALFWLWKVMPGHSLDYDTVLDPETLDRMPHAVLLGIGLLLFWAATAKSAQIPLYVWLPDAMEGPTPVSALIHAATMVTAGVYLVARSSLLFAQVPAVQMLIATIGCLTALLAAAIALTQTDLKRVLAYSTVSQLGYMFMGLGSAVQGVAGFAVVAAMFHLFTHAFFKALLFLAAGSVMHAMGGVIDMRRFRGLRHRLPMTYWTFAVGGLALAGVPPLAGFWSKDEVLSSLKLASHAVHELHPARSSLYLLLYWTAAFTALMTAFYTGRAFFLTFFGPEKLPRSDDPEATADEHGHDLGHAHAHAATAGALHAQGDLDPHRPASAPAPTAGATDEPVPQHDHSHGHEAHFGHESPPVMTIPLIVLAVCAAAVGLVFGPTGLFAHQVLHTPGFETLGHPEHGYDWMTALVGTLVAVGGLYWAWTLYGEPTPYPARLARQYRTFYQASLHKFFVDEVYDWVVVRPTRALATVLKYLDIYLVDTLLVRGAAWIPRFVARVFLAPFQNGLIQFYAAVTALSVAVLLVVLIMLQ